MSDLVLQFNDYRSRMNERILGSGSLVFKRLYALDTLTYLERSANADNETDVATTGLSVKEKELMGLCASMVLRCDDCVRYHIGTALEAGANETEIIESMEVATVVGGSIVIPHLRRAFEYLDACLRERQR